MACRRGVFSSASAVIYGKIAAVFQCTVPQTVYTLIANTSPSPGPEERQVVTVSRLGGRPGKLNRLAHAIRRRARSRNSHFALTRRENRAISSRHGSGCVTGTGRGRGSLNRCSGPCYSRLMQDPEDDAWLRDTRRNRIYGTGRSIDRPDISAKCREALDEDVGYRRIGQNKM